MLTKYIVIKIWNASRICVSSLRRGHANLLCIVPILIYVLPEQAQLVCSVPNKYVSFISLKYNSCGIWRKHFPSLPSLKAPSFTTLQLSIQNDIKGKVDALVPKTQLQGLIKVVISHDCVAHTLSKQLQ